jgi:hypothetical protein
MSTNEMPQSLFQLANHSSPYRSNESIRTISFWPFVEAFSFVQSNKKGVENYLPYASHYVISGNVISGHFR